MKTILNIYKGADGRFRFDSDFNPLKTEELLHKSITALLLSRDRDKLNKAIYMLRLAENSICVNPETSRRQFRVAARIYRPVLEKTLRAMSKGEAV